MVAATPSAVDIDIGMRSTDDLNTNTNNDSSAAVPVPDDVVQAVADAVLQQATASTTPLLNTTLHTTDTDAAAVTLTLTTDVNDTDIDGVTDAMDMDATTALPQPLPNGWILKESRSQPDYYYYFHYDSGVSSWQPPPVETNATAATGSTGTSATASGVVTPAQQGLTPSQPKTQESEASYLASVAGAAAAAVEEGISSTSSRKRSSDAVSGTVASSSSISKQRSSTSASTSASAEQSSSSSSSAPTKVRVLHILKKHRDSRRASSWRQAVCQATRDEAAQELAGLLELLQQEVSGSPDQQATFEELARTESDCSSAKRGGDLGFFGRKKMQPAFEKAAFGLQVGEMSGLVDTNSGVHVLLRIG
jgi:NIMA-interacting peptidyl-prolyl cis-trans isomerase 1